jgi:hypothetical protein
MVDLSDVIGQAIGGDRGYYVDQIIDRLRMIHNNRDYEKTNQVSDEDIVIDALMAYVVYTFKPYAHISHYSEDDFEPISVKLYSEAQKGVLTR